MPSCIRWGLNLYIFLPTFRGGEKGRPSDYTVPCTISEHKDTEGRLVLIMSKTNGVLISLINVYAPPGSDFINLFELAATNGQRIRICAGDFNVRLKPELDLSNGKTTTKNPSKRIRNMKRGCKER